MNSGKKITKIHAGILSAREVYFTLNGKYVTDPDGVVLSGKCRAFYRSGTIVLVSEDKEISRPYQIILRAAGSNRSFTLHDVVIGIGFHWQRTEDQVFKGSMKFIAEEGRITAINLIHIEEYLKSVISSEMRASSSKELLKAHAVISRSWLLAQIERSSMNRGNSALNRNEFISDAGITRWYDREDHLNYDVCADDHCQRYQGITRTASPVVTRAVEETGGEVLVYKDKICDTRYSKCCGGMTELFENVWGPVNYPYLRSIMDNPVSPPGYDPALEENENAVKWISGSPDVFCNTSDREILNQVLNDYDLETMDFFRWKVTYDQAELSDIIMTKTGIGFGTVTGLIPLERGSSGRITRLKIEGTEKTMVLGKELEIRKSLSKTHLYSSCFHVEKTDAGSGTTFTLQGAGWGHGVGLCQIGAAVMASKGYSYDDILMHYFRRTKLEKIY
ncbi:MAG: SpoIID/LytB domain-containing protein [Bacteroidales bacterium]|nr:SpoIID/LytB domain-containing protein [Bacteroidales bacterium]